MKAKIVKQVIGVINSISEWVGKVAQWAVLIAMVVVLYDVTARYVFGVATIWAYETTIMLGGSFYILGWSYVQRYNQHVRVDVVYGRLSLRGKAIIDVVYGVLFFFPLIIVLTYKAVLYTIFSYSVGEVMIETYWYPPAQPFRTVVLLGLVLFTLQGVAQFISDVHCAIRNKSL